MHHIQRNILINLIHNPNLRYKDLKPRALDPNLFMYHLKQLQRDGLVVKTENGTYQLSTAGLLDADKRMLEDNRFASYEQPRLVLLLAVFDDTKGWLLHTRSVQPVINMTGFMHGNVEMGVSLIDSASHRLEQFAGLRGKFTYKGSATITLYKGDDLESYTHCLIVFCKNPKGELIEETNIGSNEWTISPDFTSQKMIPSMKELISKIKSQNNFYIELTYKL